jgi:SulP family sulfate permease
MIKKSNLDSDIGIDNIFMSENEVFASSTSALERARDALNCGIRDNAKKSAACTIIDSVSTIANAGSF